MNKKLYTVKETADILGFSTNTVYKYLNEGTIKAVRGKGKQGRFRVTKEALENFLGAPLGQPTITTEPEVTPAEQPETEATGDNPDLDITTTQLDTTNPPLGLTISRILIIITLTLLIADTLMSKDFSIINQILRVIVITIFILVAYQFGGVRKQ